MCKAIADMRSEERTEGRKGGIKEGIKEGILEANKATALRMLKKGEFSYEMVAEMTELSLEEVNILAGNNNSDVEKL